MKSILVTSIVTLALVSCQKEAKSNQTDSTLTTTDTIASTIPEVETETYRYVAIDGSNTNVTFTDTEPNDLITVKSAQLTLTVPKTEELGDRDIYREGDIEIVKTGDSLYITQGTNVIELKKAQGQD